MPDSGNPRPSASAVNGMFSSRVRMPASPSGVYSTETRTVPEMLPRPSRSSLLWRYTWPVVSMIRAMSGQ